MLSSFSVEVMDLPGGVLLWIVSLLLCQLGDCVIPGGGDMFFD